MSNHQTSDQGTASWPSCTEAQNWLDRRAVEVGLNAASAACITKERVVWHAGFGQDAGGRAATPDSFFDLASLSKPMTGWIAAHLDARGLLELGDEVANHVPGLPPRVRHVCLADLLCHRAGLVPWLPLYGAGGMDPIDVFRLGEVWSLQAPVYSDLGYMLYGLVCEIATGRTLEQWLAILQPELVPGDRRLFRCAPVGGSEVIPCRLHTGREVELVNTLNPLLLEVVKNPVGNLGPPLLGQAQDGNARFLGTYSGHAGLFANTQGVVAMLRAWSLLPPLRRLAEKWRDRQFSVGWWLPGGVGEAGSELPEGSFGHTGFTGGSAWWSERHGAGFVLLAHRDRYDSNLAPLRREFHALCLRSLGF